MCMDATSRQSHHAPFSPSRLQVWELDSPHTVALKSHGIVEALEIHNLQTIVFLFPETTLWGIYSCCILRTPQKMYVLSLYDFLFHSEQN